MRNWRTMVVMSAVMAITAAGEAYGQSVPHRGYSRRDGTYVMPHRQTPPDGSRYNNWGSRPNVNPYTGRQGRIDPMAPPRTRRY